VTVQLLLLLCNVALSRAALNIIWSVNAGGERHTDSSGIKYNKDTAAVGEASDYGRTMTIFRVPQQDQILYQTERYHTSDFSYNIPLKDDGDYVLVLKFSEVWFNAAHQKVCLFVPSFSKLEILFTRTSTKQSYSQPANTSSVCCYVCPPIDLFIPLGV